MDTDPPLNGAFIHLDWSFDRRRPELWIVADVGGELDLVGGVSSSQALAWNRRTCRPDTDSAVSVGLFSHPAGERKDPKRQKPRGAEYRCGAQGRAGS